MDHRPAVTRYLVIRNQERPGSINPEKIFIAAGNRGIVHPDGAAPANTMRNQDTWIDLFRYCRVSLTRGRAQLR
jgi:hypothetical protein